MEQQVTVIAVEGNEAIVRGNRASACGDCVGKASCSTMGSWVERSIELRVSNTLAAQPGDTVILEVPDNAILHIAIRLYGLPMLAFICTGAAMRSLALWLTWPAAEALAALAGIAAVVAYYLWHQARVANGHVQLDVRMLRVVQACKPMLPASAV